MATTTKIWSTGTGSVTIQYTGQGDGQLTITSDPNSLYEARSMQIKVKTTDDSIERTVTIQQAAKVRIDISTAVVTVSGTYTYSGAAKTPTPTVTLNGSTVPSTGYDVSYSDNINAGTATVTVTGKNEYTGSASGTFTINKASRTISFGNTYYVQNTSTTTTRTATPSAGSGDGAITYSISSTTYATINSSTGAVTSKTSDGSATVTATIAEGTNYLSASTSYTLYVFATTHNYSYNGSYRSVTLPPGTYQLQCWGAQGGSNAANSTYGITAKTGGKGGYSVGQLTISQATGVRVYVGGQGSSSTGGYNGGGSTQGTSEHTTGNTHGISKMGGGGGATDIRLSNGSLYSRMIVAGGGSGGAMSCKRVTSSSIQETLKGTGNLARSYTYGSEQAYCINGSDSFDAISLGLEWGKTYRIELSNSSFTNPQFVQRTSGGGYVTTILPDSNGIVTLPTSHSSGDWLRFIAIAPGYGYSGTVKFYLRETVETHTDNTYSHNGYAGGGVESEAGSIAYKATQTTAGSGASFGQGANQESTYHYYASGGGGGGWYGGGRSYDSTDPNATIYSGGGSGWVNTSASASNRPSGYTGLQLDSGTTYAGNTSFPSTSGGTETGHSGNGYARITRL